MFILFTALLSFSFSIFWSVFGFTYYLVNVPEYFPQMEYIGDSLSGVLHILKGHRIKLQSLLLAVDLILLFNFQCYKCQSDFFLPVQVVVVIVVLLGSLLRYLSLSLRGQKLYYSMPQCLFFLFLSLKSESPFNLQTKVFHYLRNIFPFICLNTTSSHLSPFILLKYLLFIYQVFWIQTLSL